MADSFAFVVDTIDEEKFFRGVKKMPPHLLQQYLTFQILPEEMKERLHKNLQEVNSGWTCVLL